MKKKILAILCLVIMLLGMTGTAVAETAAEQVHVNIYIDGILQNIAPSLGTPFIDENSRTLVPLRGVFEAIGAEVGWIDDARQAVVKKDGKTALVPIGEKYILVDGVRIENDSNAIIKNDRTYLPIRIVLESFGCGVGWNDATKSVLVTTEKGDMKAVWVSFLDYDGWPKDEAGFKAAYDVMLTESKSLGFNSIIFQVRPDSDALYPSSVYPWSKFVSGTQGQNPGYDPLAYMVERAHAENMEFHAWINPFRVTGYKCGWSALCDDNPAKTWLSDSDPANDRWVLKQQDLYYMNPSVPQVREMIVAGVREIVENYPVDGIHFDDYFYPSLNNSDANLWFDKPEYDLSSSGMDITSWRRNNVNLLVKEVYSTVKAANPSAVFGISPSGNMANLRSASKCFADVDTWLTQDGYVDYIMPQLYWGFDVTDNNGNKASYAYDVNLQSWINLCKQGNVKLMVGMNMEYAGNPTAYRNSNGEWGNSQSVLARMVSYAKSTGAVKGYALFRYGIIHQSAATEAEFSNLRSVL